MFRKAAVAYLLVQGTALVAYWAVLALLPAARAPFMPPGSADARVLFAIAIPDGLFYMTTSLAGAYGIARTRNWVGPILWLHAGAALYAALLAIAMFIADTSRWVGVLLMSPALVAPLAIAVRFAPPPR